MADFKSLLDQYTNTALPSVDPTAGTFDSLLTQYAQSPSATALLGGPSVSVSENQNKSFARRAFEGTLRTVAGGLEPLQLPKDVLDAIIAGSLDDKTTIGQRLGNIQWGKYAPWGATPARAATGEEIAGLMGIQSEAAKRWVGLGMDIFVDPLLFGSWLRVAGKVTKVGELVDLGDTLERAISLKGVYKGGRALLPEAARTALDERMSTALRSLASSRVFWNSGPSARTWGDFFLSQSTALDLQLPGFGKQLVKMQQLAKQEGRVVANRALGTVHEAIDEILGPQKQTFMRKLGQAFGRYGKANATVDGVPNELAQAIFRRGYDVADRVGYATRGSARAAAAPELEQFLGAVPRSRVQTSIMSHERMRIREIATKVGYDPEQAVRKFDNFTEKVAEADALLGYHLTGYDVVKTGFFESMLRGGVSAEDATSLWQQTLHQGVTANDSKKFMDMTMQELADGAGVGLAADPFTGRGLGDVTVREALGASATFQSIDLGLYLQGLKNGHMRRAFGVFQDGATYDNYIKKVRTGEVLPLNFIDKVDLPNVMSNPDAAAATKDFLDSVRFDVPKNVLDQIPQGERTRGLILSQADIAQALVDRVGAKEAQKAVGELVQHASKSPVLQRTADLLVDRTGQYGAQLAKGTIPAREYGRLYGDIAVGFGSTAVSKERADISYHLLNTMGELANPVISVAEESALARQRIPWSRFMSDVAGEAYRAGYVKDGFYRGFVPLENDATMWGALAGQYVHPMLKKELLTVMKRRTTKTGTAFNRIRSLVTGGYLASPNVITANIFGGLYTSALLGIHPGRMLTSMAQTMNEFRRASSDPNYTFEALESLKRYISLDDTSLVGNNIRKVIEKHGRQGAGVGPARAQRMFNELTDAIQSQLDAPLGQKWAGLEGFQFAENLMKLSVFSSERSRMLKEAGYTLDDLLGVGARGAKPWERVYTAMDDKTQQLLDIEKQAAEMARISVFDYSELPDSLRMLRDYGLILFPGFPFFLSGRTINAAINRPGILAASDRLSDAISQAQLDDTTKRAVYAVMPDWLKEEQGVPIPFLTHKDENGNLRGSFIPFNQLVPTATFAGNPWGESLASGGIWKPFIEAASAWFVNGTGEAPFSAQYGTRVYEQGVSESEKLAQTAGYLANSLAPGVLRKLAAYNPGDGFKGIAPQMLKQLGVSWGAGNAQFGNTIYSINEIRNRRADRKLWDEAVAITLRSPQVVTLGGPLSSVKKQYDGSKRDLQNELQVLKSRRDRAMLAGNQKLAQKLTTQIADRYKEWVQDTLPMLEAVQQYQQKQQ